MGSPSPPCTGKCCPAGSQDGLWVCRGGLWLLFGVFQAEPAQVLQGSLDSIPRAQCGTAGQIPRVKRGRAVGAGPFPGHFQEFGFLWLLRSSLLGECTRTGSVGLGGEVSHRNSKDSVCCSQSCSPPSPSPSLCSAGGAPAGCCG